MFHRSFKRFALIIVLGLSFVSPDSRADHPSGCAEAQDRARYDGENMIRMIREQFLPEYNGMIDHLRANNYTPIQIRSLSDFDFAFRRCDRRGAPQCTTELESWLRANWSTGTRMQESKMSELNATLPAPVRNRIAGLNLVRTFDFVIDQPGLYGQVRVNANLVNRALVNVPIKEIVLGSFQVPGHIGARNPKLAIYYLEDDGRERSYMRELRNGWSDSEAAEFLEYYVRDVSRAACG